MNVVFRTDGGPEIGYGHLMRSSAVADALLDQEVNVTVATTTPAAARESFPESVTVASLPARDDPEPFCDLVATSGTDVVYTDAYPIQWEYQRAIRELTPHVAFEDYAAHPVAAGVLVNNNLYADSLEYDFLDVEPRTCFGPRYALLREPIRAYTSSTPPWRPDAERAVVSMGGSDTTEQTPVILEAFDGYNLRVDAIVGPGVASEQERTVRKVAAEVSADVRVHRNPDDLPERFFEADFAVTTASSTTYELLALGTPLIALPVVDHQELIADELRERELAIVLPRDAGTPDVDRAIETYVQDPPSRRRRRGRGRELVDGNGGRRVADAMLDLL